jgi:hypothetical protein
MKNLLKITLFTAAMFVFFQGHAATKQDTTFGQKVKRTATKVGHKTSQIAANGEASIVDKKYDGKYGPYGETVYIDKNSHYYYITHKGHKVYIAKSRLKDHK